jgi:hypothetical protein
MRPKLSLIVVAAAVACSDSPFTPTIENVAGDYDLQTLTTTDLGPPRNWVAEGATLTMSLSADGTTAGRLFIPGADTGGTDLDADMAGTWTLSGDTVTFSQVADSFIRDMAFVARENRLVGDHAFGGSGVSVRVVLTK